MNDVEGWGADTAAMMVEMRAKDRALPLGDALSRDRPVRSEMEHWQSSERVRKSYSLRSRLHLGF